MEILRYHIQIFKKIDLIQFLEMTMKIGTFGRCQACRALIYDFPRFRAEVVED